ncbi:MAG: D-alanyl-D-alanine carboxypeptidase/D-alanyl-D-alanine endopeptidase [Fibrobacterota bacterium]
MQKPVILLILCTFFSARSTSLNDIIRDIIRDEGFLPRQVSFTVIRESCGDTLADIGGARMLIPASVQKLFTGAAALDMLGTQFTFRSEITADHFDRSAGVLSGTTVIRGTGDPSLTAQRLWLFVTHLKQQGVTKITDTLRIDNTYFRSPNIVAPGFGTSSSSRAYMAPSSPLAANFNALAVHIAPGRSGSPAYISTLPLRSDLVRVGTVMTRKKPDRRLDVSTYREHDTTYLYVSGDISSSSTGRTFYRRIWSADTAFAEAFIDLCREKGISVDVVTTSGKHLEIQKDPLVSFPSQPMPRHIRNMFKYSNNYIAETIFRTIALENSGDGSWKSGQKEMQTWFASRFDTAALGVPVIINGSGMGIKNRISSHQITALLAYAAQQAEWKYEFLAALPVAGIDGTLSRRMKSPALRGRVRAKTGTLSDSGVNNIAGWIQLRSGEDLIFSLLLNNPRKGSYAHWQLQEKILTAVIQAGDAISGQTEKNE